MCVTNPEEKERRKKQKELERIEKEKKKNGSQIEEKPQERETDTYTTVKFVLIGVHFIVGVFIITGRYFSA